MNLPEWQDIYFLLNMKFANNCNMWPEGGAMLGPGPPPPLSSDKSYARCTDRVVFCHRMDTVVQTGTWCTLANAGYNLPPLLRTAPNCMYVPADCTPSVWARHHSWTATRLLGKQHHNCADCHVQILCKSGESPCKYFVQSCHCSSAPWLSNIWQGHWFGKIISPN